MKKFLLYAALIFSAVAACVFSACAKQKTVPAESIAFSETSYILESRQTLDAVCTTVPENASVKVEISNPTVVAYENGNLTALTFGDATVKVYSASDESIFDTCTVTVKPPEDYIMFSAVGYCKFVYPEGWEKTFYSDTGLTIFTDSVTGANVNFVKENQNDSYFKAPAATFKNALTGSYSSAGYTVTGMQCSVGKETHLGYTRVHVVYDYTLNSELMHQEQMILNSGGKTCILTLTFKAAALNKDILNTVFFEFVGLG